MRALGPLDESGCVTRKRGLWYAVVSVTDPETGERRRDWGSGFRTRKEAARRLTEVLSRLDRGTYVEPTRLTVAEYLREKWLPAVRASLQPGTLALYEVTLAAYVAPRIGSIPLQILAPSHLNALYAELLECGARAGERGLAPKTVRNVHTLIHRALADAVKWGNLSRNVAAFADPPKRRSREMRTWTAGQVRAFLESAREERLYPAFALAAGTGMRRGEILGLRWSDVDFEGSRLAIRRSLVLVSNRPMFSTPKTDKGRRSVAVDPVTLAALREHRKRQLEERLAGGPAYEDNDLVFCREDGAPLRLS